jgi:hypothetical protein
MLKPLFFRRAMAALVLALTPAVALTAPLSWTIQGGLLDGGAAGSIFGSFDFDSDNEQFSNVNITVDELGSQTYFSDYDVDSATGFPQFALISGYDGGSGGPFTGAPILVLGFDANLVASNSPVAFSSFSFFGECNNDYCLEASAFYSVSGAAITAVPVPAAAWLFGSALLGLAGIKRKK